MSWSEQLEPYWELITAAGAILGPVLSVFTMGCILVTKKNSTSAVAWCLLIFFVPVFGSLFFLLFGYQQIHRPLLPQDITAPQYTDREFGIDLVFLIEDRPRVYPFRFRVASVIPR